MWLVGCRRLEGLSFPTTTTNLNMPSTQEKNESYNFMTIASSLGFVVCLAIVLSLSCPHKFGGYATCRAEVIAFFRGCAPTCLLGFFAGLYLLKRKVQESGLPRVGFTRLEEIPFVKLNDE
eukprot:m.256106 g.256106  ORF g.256106 m.256106 type:complete len:121 (+) comp15512_c3_seq1:75-437(+)